ncbi:HAMP domain-containing sensor histidine kinase [Clostridium oceanicum]|uniref:histidine kinase n=1 Tax=Clostridium oceanicum TaxID=1543 RepID=A0ABP3UY67_9CLOT
MNSIKKRLVSNFIIIIIISVVILELLLIIFTKKYYYNNLEEVMTNQIKMSSEFYDKYFSNASLKENILDNVDAFWTQTSAQVQVVDLSGNILMDSIGVYHSKQLYTTDFIMAKNGKKGVLTKEVDYDDHKVMIVSYPLLSRGKIIGVLRFITSLRAIDKQIYQIYMGFILIGVIVTIISIILSVFLADSIIVPIKELNYVANKMASGNFKIRSNKTVDDEIGELSDTLNYMADEIVKKEQMKNEFISSVSHELRTPLTSIKGWAITLNSQKKYDELIFKDGLKIIENESERLTEMVEDLLDFSRLISNKMQLRRENVNLYTLVKEVNTQMNPYAERSKINLNLVCESPLISVYVDKNRIKQVLINLLDNAFRFTEENGMVSLKVYEEDENVIIIVEDNGLGINEEDLPRVKEKFYKGKTVKSKSGIGLSICDEIIKLHNGVFNIESELNVGTKVYVKLPKNFVD